MRRVDRCARAGEKSCKFNTPSFWLPFGRALGCFAFASPNRCIFARGALHGAGQGCGFERGILASSHLVVQDCRHGLRRCIGPASAGSRWAEQTVQPCRKLWVLDEIFLLRKILAQMCGGRDLTRLPALSEYGVLQLIGEVGTDLSIWPTEKHFTVWAGLAPPGSHDSGKRKKGVRRGRNRTGQLFCMMAQSLVRSKAIALGGFYRRLAARRGGLIATKALARKLAGWFWRVMVKGDDYVEQGSRAMRSRSARSRNAL
ncbi:transposase [Paraburkholderia sp. BR10937]|uniref:transposase n=1 Tax=Paraburkholderia sp. BR10937 TaxID=3236994 RepID=UPI0034D38AC6